MVNKQYTVSTFRAAQLQKLRNVRIHSPCIVQILSGSKRLFLQQQHRDLTGQTLLLCHASMSLSFENLPEKGTFTSRMFSLHYPPDEALLELSRKNKPDNHLPLIRRPRAIEITLNAMYSLTGCDLSPETQICWLQGLYQQLAEMGVLHLLFREEAASFSQAVSCFLAASPEQQHTLESVAAHFAVSRATFIRRLRQEDSRYREILAEVRLNHALNLMQQGVSQIHLLAQLCGYQSESRFSQRFRSQFGLTPKSYLLSLQSESPRQSG